jgi:hypothetical protein
MIKRIFAVSLACLLFFGAISISSIRATPRQQAISGHPRLWVRAQDLPRLRSWAVDSNPMYRDGLAILAANAKSAMDNNLVPDTDSGGIAWEQYPTEMYAMLFAFMSLIENNQATRDDYAQRARTLLMAVMNEAAQGEASGQPFRDRDFSIDDRSRWWGEGFALTVDWIYPYLTTQDKATIRQVFLRWANENRTAGSTDFNNPGWNGTPNDPSYLSDPLPVRWAANNYYMAHMRNMGMMALALDDADDPNGALRAYLDEAVGAWLYVVDHLLRTDAQGGFSPEGWEYGPESLSYTAQFMLALHTAGVTDTVTWGNQVDLSGNPFWNDVVWAFLHSLSPDTTIYDDFSWIGSVYQPAWFGDGQNYWVPDAMALFGPLALYDYNTGGNAPRLNAIRWIQTHVPPGGETVLIDRVQDTEEFRNSILYYMVYDPSAPASTDPRPGQAPNFYAPGIGRILARTDWGVNASFFTYHLGWINIDHQLAEGNQFEFYRNGEWLTKGRVGWDGTDEACTIGRSDYHNTLALENDSFTGLEPDHFLYTCQAHGSQWIIPSRLEGGQILAHSFHQDYVYTLGDATPLYNEPDLGPDDITRASRAIVWLKPDHIVVYDRAESQTAGRFKRFWLNLPGQPTLANRRASASTDSGQQLFVTSLLPANATITSDALTPGANGEANGEPMRYRLQVEAAGGPQNTRFLHVLQGAGSGAGPDTTVLIESDSGPPFSGALVDDTAVLFPIDLDTPFSDLVYTIPAGTRSIITGLTPGGSYDVITQTVGSDIQITLRDGSAHQADSGGVLMISLTGAPPQPSQKVYLPLIVKKDMATPAPTPIVQPTPSPGDSPQVAGCDVFPPDNIWNAPVDSLPLDANSGAYIATIGADGTLHADFGSGEWPPGSGAPIGIPYIDVPASQAGVNVSFTYDDESDPGPYPVPANAPIEGGSNSDGDRHVLVVDRDNCLLYELFYAFPQPDGSWTADSGAIFDLGSHALRPEGWTSADAAGLPILPGLVRYEEVAAGEIRHALRFTVPQTRRDYVWPGRHFASDLTGPQYPPMGQRFRLRADFDLSGFSTETQVILQALQTYGMILADNGSAWFISGAPDENWDNDILQELGQVTGANFEAVDTTSLIISPDSGQANIP